MSKTNSKIEKLEDQNDRLLNEICDLSHEVEYMEEENKKLIEMVAILSAKLNCKMNHEG